jgi:phosphoribosylformimino-5-aminoimidazole carboxamide ribotide isomerase
MSAFTIYPAIDLRFGKVVRLSQGQGDRQTVYGDDPASTAQSWITQGAEWLHVVNLNGAFGEATAQNESAIENIVAAAKNKAKVQLGGGIRELDHIEKAFALGVTRVVLGTAVIENPSFGIEAISSFGAQKIAFGFDALEDELMSRGWKSHSGQSMLALAQTLKEAGGQTVIYTNILKDGMQTGVDWQVAKHLSDQTGLSVIASGGTVILEDIVKVHTAGLSGVIIGRALYEGNFTLQEALHVC